MAYCSPLLDLYAQENQITTWQLLGTSQFRGLSHLLGILKLRPQKIELYFMRFITIYFIQFVGLWACSKHTRVRHVCVCGSE